MLAGFVGILLSGSLGVAPSPHHLEGGDVCLMRTRCAQEPVFCLVRQSDCDPPAEPPICFAEGCREKGLRLQP
ncbi:MAG TPA: hypothetical protein VHN37_13535 [Actinomycetota bacterium]|nr:hypothetical protein [Actinomycetota bacterium]